MDGEILDHAAGCGVDVDCLDGYDSAIRFDTTQIVTVGGRSSGCLPLGAAIVLQLLPTEGGISDGNPAGGGGSGGKSASLHT